MTATIERGTSQTNEPEHADGPTLRGTHRSMPTAQVPKGTTEACRRSNAEACSRGMFRRHALEVGSLRCFQAKRRTLGTAASSLATLTVEVCPSLIGRPCRLSRPQCRIAMLRGMAVGRDRLQHQCAIADSILAQIRVSWRVIDPLIHLTCRKRHDSLARLGLRSLKCVRRSRDDCHHRGAIVRTCGCSWSTWPSADSFSPTSPRMPMAIRGHLMTHLTEILSEVTPLGSVVAFDVRRWHAPKNDARSWGARTGNTLSHWLLRLVWDELAGRVWRVAHACVRACECLTC